MATAIVHVSNLDLSIRTREDHVGITFAGYLDVPVDGLYTFFMRGDTGVGLWIHDAHVIDADYAYDGSERSETIRLGTGLHPILVFYHHRVGAHQLSLDYAGPTTSRQPIPGSMLFHPGPSVQGPVANDSISTVKGDVNNDGTFNGADVVFLTSWVAGLEAQIEAATVDGNFDAKADVNGDGEVDGSDVSYMASSVAGLSGFLVEGHIE